jgi:hypothetical protein
MAVMRGGYPMVVRPAAISYFLPQAEPGATPDPATVRQNVQFRDREGLLWMATYVLERQAGAGWRIDGCRVVDHSGKSMTGGRSSRRLVNMATPTALVWFKRDLRVRDHAALAEAETAGERQRARFVLC